MSVILLKFAESFLEERLSVETFAEAYQELWKIERDNGFAPLDPGSLSEVLSSIFILADNFCPPKYEPKDEYEFNEAELRQEISALLKDPEAYYAALDKKIKDSQR